MQRPQISLSGFPTPGCRRAQDHSALAIRSPEALDVLRDVLRVESPLRAQERAVALRNRTGIDASQQVTEKLLRRRNSGITILRRGTGYSHPATQQLFRREHNVAAAHVVRPHLDSEELRPLLMTGAAEPIDLDAVRRLAALDQLQLVARTEGAQESGHPDQCVARDHEVDARSSSTAQHAVVESFLVEELE